jgi:hypothetical protein
VDGVCRQPPLEGKLPAPKVYYNPYGAKGVHNGAGMDVMDVFVDNKELIYLSSYNGGLEIVEFTG